MIKIHSVSLILLFAVLAFAQNVQNTAEEEILKKLLANNLLQNNLEANADLSEIPPSIAREIARTTARASKALITFQNFVKSHVPADLPTHPVCSFFKKQISNNHFFD